MRHDFVMRKFALITTLLGSGAIAKITNPNLSIDLSWLLYLAPIVAIAFDFYIQAEDYRIRRAGTLSSEISRYYHINRKGTGEVCKNKAELYVCHCVWLSDVHLFGWSRLDVIRVASK